MLNFATYNNYSIKLDNVYLFFLEVLACFAILIVLRVRNEKISFLDMQSNLQLRGMAILTLIIGHFSLFCLKERIFFSRFGYLSVMVFLFSSGYGLTVKYNFESINTSFWKNRIIKIFIPFWLVLILFIGLDRELLDISYSWKYIFFNLTGLCPPGKAYDLINASLWYIEYLLLLYLIYYTISHIDTTKHKKLLLFTLFLLTIHSVIIYSAFLFQRKNIWIEYTLVFPLGILLALHRKNVAKFLESTNQSFIKLAFFTFFLLIFFFWTKIFPKNIQIYLTILKPIPFLLCLVLLFHLIAKLSKISVFLELLGKYSYEIYLLHFPFMIKYDFFLHRKPTLLFFFVYFSLLTIFAYVLHRVSRFFYGMITKRSFTQ